MSNKLCPACGESIHRSHTRGLKERLVKSLSSYRTYRCHDCGWRGWLKREQINKRSFTLKTKVSIVLALVATALVAIYIIGEVIPHTPAPVYDEQLDR